MPCLFLLSSFSIIHNQPEMHEAPVTEKNTAMGSEPQTWLQKLETQLNIDVDWMDPTYSKELQITPNDMTSNNLWVNIQMSHEENKEMFAQVCKELKGDWKAAYTRIAVNMCKNNIDNIKGRVLLQVYPNEAYDTQAVLDSARAYAKEFERVGISQDRYCIKIPSVGPALAAVPQLKKEGIQTLGTALFSLAQAIAASQAGCLYISPYFNGKILSGCTSYGTSN